MEPLTQRQEAILRGVVESHIDTTQPVGSRYITQRYLISLSPATIRNEMGLLEEMGFLSLAATEYAVAVVEQPI